MASNTGRLNYLDALRGIAALSVVIFHYTLDMAGQNVLGKAGMAFAYTIAHHLDLGKYGVVLFFLISGYIIPNSLGATVDRIGRFCVSRFFRLYPLYWIAVAVGVFLPWPQSDGSPGYWAIAANLTMIQGYLGQKDIVLTAWTLQIELAFYAACVVLAAMHRMTSPRSCALASVGFLVVALVVAIVRAALLKELPVALPLALSLMFFGTVWRQATLAGLPEARRLAKPLLVAVIVMIVPISLLAYNHDYRYHENWQSYVTCYTAAILTFVLCTTRFPIVWRPFVWLGQISYSLYLIHPLVAAAAYHAGFGAAAVPVPPMVYVAALAALSVLCAWTTYTFVEKPSIRLGRHLTDAFLRTPSSRSTWSPSADGQVTTGTK